METFLIKCFKPDPYPPVLLKYFQYICELEFKTKPDYKKIRKILGNALDELGSSPHDKLIFGKKVKIRNKFVENTDLYVTCNKSSLCTTRLH